MSCNIHCPEQTNSHKSQLATFLSDTLRSLHPNCSTTVTTSSRYPHYLLHPYPGHRTPHCQPSPPCTLTLHSPDCPCGFDPIRDPDIPTPPHRLLHTSLFRRLGLGVACARVGELVHRRDSRCLVVELGRSERNLEDDMCECNRRMVLCEVSILLFANVYVLLQKLD